MQCLFVGVGEAFDERLTNCSVLLQSQTTLLLDCGYTVPSSYWRLAEHPAELDAIWISHFHGDHYFGLSALLLRMYEEGRNKPLTLVSQPGLEERLSQCLDLAYPNLRRRLPFALNYLEAVPGQALELNELRLACAQSEHGQRNYSLRVSDNRASVLYSGDGRPTAETLELARGADLVIHESFALAEDIPGHGTVAGSMEFCRAAGVPRLALVHLHRDVRHGQIDHVKELMASAPEGLAVLLPESGQRLELG